MRASLSRISVKASLIECIYFVSLVIVSALYLQLAVVVSKVIRAQELLRWATVWPQ